MSVSNHQHCSIAASGPMIHTDWAGWPGGSPALSVFRVSQSAERRPDRGAPSGGSRYAKFSLIRLEPDGGRSAGDGRQGSMNAEL